MPSAYNSVNKSGDTPVFEASSAAAVEMFLKADLKDMKVRQSLNFLISVITHKS